MSDEKPTLVETVSTLAEAKARVDELMKRRRYEYIIVGHADGQRIVVKPHCPHCHRDFKD